MVIRGDIRNEPAEVCVFSFLCAFLFFLKKKKKTMEREKKAQKNLRIFCLSWEAIVLIHCNTPLYLVFAFPSAIDQFSFFLAYQPCHLHVLMSIHDHES